MFQNDNQIGGFLIIQIRRFKNEKPFKSHGFGILRFKKPDYNILYTTSCNSSLTHSAEATPPSWPASASTSRARRVQRPHQRRPGPWRLVPRGFEYHHEVQHGRIWGHKGPIVLAFFQLWMARLKGFLTSYCNEKTATGGSCNLNQLA